MRFRDIYLGVGSVLVLAVVFMSDPSVGLISQLPFGSSTLGLIINIIIMIIKKVIKFLVCLMVGEADVALTI